MHGVYILVKHFLLIDIRQPIVGDRSNIVFSYSSSGFYVLPYWPILILYTLRLNISTAFGRFRLKLVNSDIDCILYILIGDFRL